MADLSQNEKAEANAIYSESSSEEVTKVDKLLSDEHDPDAGKSDEERAAIVRLSNSITSDSTDISDRKRS